MTSILKQEVTNAELQKEILTLRGKISLLEQELTLRKTQTKEADRWITSLFGFWNNNHDDKWDRL